MFARSSGLGLRLIWRPLWFLSNKCVIYMNINFSWNFHQKVFTLTISFNGLNASIEFVLIYRPHPVCIPINETVISQTELLYSVSQFLYSYICGRFIYFQDRSAYSAVGKYVDRSWEYINHSQTHECGNWSEAAEFPEKEYVNGNFLAVYTSPPPKSVNWLLW